MKKYNVEIRTNINEAWDSDAVQEYITAENEAEAIEFAIDYLMEQVTDNGEDPEIVNEWEFRAFEA